ncbi:xylose isomerase, partial [Rhodovulum sulfidophilum]|nr:xylose isomerase [Rhodovulum sulfidophilum]
MTDFFHGIDKIAYEGPDSTNPLAFRHYDPDALVLGKRMEEHLRFAAAYWHSLAYEGLDPFGGRTFERPWYGDGMERAFLKADVAFELFSKLGVPYFCFHDADMRPEGKTLVDTVTNLNRVAEVFAHKMEATGIRLLWG